MFPIVGLWEIAFVQLVDEWPKYCKKISLLLIISRGIYLYKYDLVFRETQYTRSQLLPIIPYFYGRKWNRSLVWVHLRAVSAHFWQCFLALFDPGKCDVCSGSGLLSTRFLVWKTTRSRWMLTSICEDNIFFRLWDILFCHHHFGVIILLGKVYDNFFLESQVKMQRNSENRIGL